MCMVLAPPLGATTINLAQHGPSGRRQAPFSNGRRKRVRNSLGRPLQSSGSRPKLHVKLDPDNVRSVLVFVPHIDEPIEALLSTFDLHIPISLELIRALMAIYDYKLPFQQRLLDEIDMALEEIRAGGNSRGILLMGASGGLEQPLIRN